MLLHCRYTMPDRLSRRSRHAIILVSILLLSTIAFVPSTSVASSSKTTSIWNGTVNLADGYTVESGDILIVEQGTTINLGNDKDLSLIHI